MLTRPWNIYAEQLLPLGYGHPLLYAEPDLVTHREVLVGDIGTLHKSHFLPLLNTIRSANDPLNQGNVPDDFRPLALPENLRTTRTDALTQPILVSRGITLEGEPNPPPDPAGGWRFRSHADAGAVLVLEPPGIADDLDIRARPSIIEYMRENLDSWREHAWSQWRALKDKDVLFVCGTVNTTRRWGTNAVRDRHFLGKEGRIAGDLAQAGNWRFRFADHFPQDQFSTGPGIEEGDGGTSVDGGAIPSQCLFMHYYKMKRAATGDTTLHRPRPSAYIIESCPGPNEIEYDPVSCLLDYILEQSEAPIAAASDMDVTSLFSGQPFPEWDQFPEAIRRVLPSIDIDEHGVGTISIPRTSMR
ncbi:hypothetical protein V8D89_009078 [Ganoderma adspersum]